jgi:hypothetical protein
MVQQQEPPQLLQLLLLGKLQGDGGDGDVVDIIDLNEEEDREQEQQRQQKLFQESGADCVLVHVKQGPSTAQDKQQGRQGVRWQPLKESGNDGMADNTPVYQPSLIFVVRF